MKVTSILTKVLMAVSGLAWVGFLIGHLAGNTLLFKSPEAFDAYGLGLHNLGGGAAVILAEIGLAAFFLAHMISGIRTWNANKAARKQGYAVKANAGESSFASRTMIIGGIVIVVFLVVHLWNFKLQWDPEAGESLYELTVTTLKDPLWAGFYLVSLVFIGLHVSHGFGSAFQTLGVVRPDWRLKLRSFGRAFGWVITAGFMTIPVWALLVAKVN